MFVRKIKSDYLPFKKKPKAPRPTSLPPGTALHIQDEGSPIERKHDTVESPEDITSFEFNINEITRWKAEQLSEDKVLLVDYQEELKRQKRELLEQKWLEIEQILQGSPELLKKENCAHH